MLPEQFRTISYNEIAARNFQYLWQYMDAKLLQATPEDCPAVRGSRAEFTDKTIQLIRQVLCKPTENCGPQDLHVEAINNMVTHKEV